MNKTDQIGPNFNSDTATLSFQPFVNLIDKGFTNLTAESALQWFENAKYDSWGPAMLIYKPFRYLLQAGGLEIADEDVSLFRTQNSNWNKLYKKFKNKRLTLTEAIYFARGMFYLGFHAESEKLLRKTLLKSKKQPELAGWCLLLLAQIDRTTNLKTWSSKKLEHFHCLGPKISPLLEFNIRLQIAIRYSTDGNLNRHKAESFLDKCKDLLDQSKFFSDPFHACLGRSRWARYYSLHLLNQGKISEQRSFLTTELNQLKVPSVASSRNLTVHSQKFLKREALRRLLDHQTLVALNEMNYNHAIKSAREACEVDPYCPRAHMILGECLSLAGKKAQSIVPFEKSAIYGLLERPYSKLRIAQSKPVTHITFAIDLQDAIESDFYFSNAFLRAATNSLLNSDAKPFSYEVQSVTEQWMKILRKGKRVPADSSYISPVYISQYENLEKSIPQTNFNAVRSNLLRSEAYNRFLPYWELKKPTLRTPDIGMAPLVAWESFKEKKIPYFKSVALQRIPMPDFRESLFHAGVRNSQLKKTGFKQFIHLDGLNKDSPEVQRFLDVYSRKRKLSVLEQAMFGRVLGNLGFIEEAVNYCNLPSLECPLNPESYYLLNTAILYRVVLKKSPQIPLTNLLEAAYHLAPKGELGLRSHLSITLIGSIYHGQKAFYGDRSEITHLQKWRDRAFPILENILDSGNFEEFDKNLLHSRLYRGVTYIPFFLNDKKTLRKEAELCEKYARLAKPRTALQKLLFTDNLYSMLDSMQRIHLKLGDTDRAVAMFDEITNDIDPMDSRFWLGKGTLLESLGRHEEALNAFVTSGRLAVPVGHVGWFRAGLLFEQLGELSEAKKAYFKSLELWPEGISPLEGLRRVSKTEKNKYLQTWCKNELEKFSE